MPAPTAVIFVSFAHSVRPVWFEQGRVMGEFKTRGVNYATMSDEVGLAYARDQKEFEDIYRNYCGLVQRICLRMLRDPIEAEDAAQDVFVRVLAKFHTFRGESAFSSWLYRLTVNSVLMRFRKNKHRCASLGDSIDDEGTVCSEIGVHDMNLSGALARIDLQAAINSLPAGYRRAFVMHDIHGYDHWEIASIFGYSVGNSKSQLHKARIQLRKLLCHGGGAPRNRRTVQISHLQAAT
jgi:RNA polymerase sigma-70 factor, ECF subfamily